MPTDIVFNPATADEARRKKALPEPTQQRVSPPSPAGQSELDPTYNVTTDRTGPFDAVASDRERRESREVAQAVGRYATENPVELAYRLAVPVELVHRILALEVNGAPQYVIDRLSALERLPAQIDTLTKRIWLLEKEHDDLAAHVKVLDARPIATPNLVVNPRAFTALQRDVAALKLAIPEAK